MAEPLPDAEWWPLKWARERPENLPSVEVDGVLVVDCRGEKSRTGYCVYRRTSTYPNVGYDEVQEGIPDLLTLRALLLKLAYPGGKYG